MKPNFERYHDIIPEFSLFQESLHEPLPTHLRVNRLKAEPETVTRLLKEKGIYLEKATEKDDTLYFVPGLHSSGNLLEYFTGYIHPQVQSLCRSSSTHRWGNPFRASGKRPVRPNDVSSSEC